MSCNNDQGLTSEIKVSAGSTIRRERYFKVLTCEEELRKCFDYDKTFSWCSNDLLKTPGRVPLRVATGFDREGPLGVTGGGLLEGVLGGSERLLEHTALTSPSASGLELTITSPFEASLMTGRMTLALIGTVKNATESRRSSIYPIMITKNLKKEKLDQTPGKEVQVTAIAFILVAIDVGVLGFAGKEITKDD
ncbi:hypothetical protein K435DRAFT_810806 [Dendrothele bispora CBS 962.96]|uniref:Uncharacterized protein n=1 Tax=Dendrothele bispora (strain CBS 962.96) TaxID=1314807 RepID=A0A4S8KU84_DENBC|nr:hypothetical protein K435DRAFT_810806 [Dendrothele bispora CBS 962.96]